MELLTQLNRAMAYIEAHLDDALALEDVARVTGYSPYHFGRVFNYIAELPLSEYIRRRKLSLAAMKLQSGRDKVIDLAILYGYDSADSFTRAFVKQHGIPPSQARQPGRSLTIFPPLTFQIKIEGVQAMNWRIEEREAFEVFGFERVFRSDEDGKVPSFWDELKESGEMARLEGAAGASSDPTGRHRINAVCGHRETPGDTFPYLIGALKTAECRPEGFCIAQIPAATWAVFRSEKKRAMGSKIMELVTRAYGEWLPSSGYEKVPGPDDLEIYYTADDGSFVEEVWIPVKRA
jgi:AraC family transcriptional regulator